MMVRSSWEASKLKERVLISQGEAMDQVEYVPWMLPSHYRPCLHLRSIENLMSEIGCGERRFL